MILNRLGNKSKIAKDIQKHFPSHSLYIEPFFGAGGMFFNKPKAKQNIMNDLDSDVYNLFNVLVNRKDDLFELFKLTPYHQDLLNYWKKNKETDPIKKAMRFLFLSNYTYMGKMGTLIFGQYNPVNVLEKKLKETTNYIHDVQFANMDFRKFFKSIRFINLKDVFIYCDPPYINTGSNYSDNFTLQDTIDLFDCLENIGCKYAVSEFNNPIIVKHVKDRNLNVTPICERQTLQNRNTEILVTNYINELTLF